MVKVSTVNSKTKGLTKENNCCMAYFNILEKNLGGVAPSLFSLKDEQAFAIMSSILSLLSTHNRGRWTYFFYYANAWLLFVCMLPCLML